MPPHGDENGDEDNVHDSSNNNTPRNSQQSNGNGRGNSGQHNDDSSGNNTHVDVSFNIHYTDSSYSLFDVSCDDTLPVVVPIVSDISFTVVDGSGYEIVTKTGKAADGTKITRVTFDSTHPELYDPNITENLSNVVTTYDDEAPPNSQTDILLNQIRGYAADIQCSDFHGKGSIEDYTALFQAASKIATDTKHMELNVDIEGFNEFASAADDLSELFEGFITKLQNVNIITDITFLTAIATALGKIVNLSNIFGKFKQTVFATSTIQLPKSAHDTKIVIEGVMSEVNCAMQYIQFFVDPSSNPTLHDAQLSSIEKNIISKSVDTIESWNILCEQGISIAMSNDPDVKYIQEKSAELKTTTNTLKTVTNNLKSKLASLHILC